MAWISVHQQIRDHRKTRNLFRALNINRAEAIGTLTLIWSWAVDNCNQEGELLSVTKEDIADAAYWRQDPDVLYNALVETGWIDELDGKIYLHDWYEFNKPFYDYIARKERDKQRKRNASSTETPSSQGVNSTDIPQENRAEFHDSPSPSPSPSPLDTTTATTRVKENEKTDKPDKPDKPIEGQVFDYAEKTWGRLLIPKDIEVITLAINDFVTRGSKEAKGLVCDAIDRCGDHNVRTAKYLDSIVRRWIDQGILDMETLKRDDEKFEKKKERASPKGDKTPPPPKTPKGKYEKFYL